ncbi:uncharacterized protein [Henckelia pumila]|uniref:uncharacterized protein n=1 Tax=Henckelia pumila TaxID=405737 RepID=UPI003C6E2CC7
MEAPVAVAVPVQVKLELGSETYFAEANTGGGLVSDHLVSIKERSMTILNDFITKHKDDLPDDDDDNDNDNDDDDDDEDEDEDEDNTTPPPPVNKKSKKQHSPLSFIIFDCSTQDPLVADLT